MYIFLYLYLFTSTWNSAFAYSYFSIPNFAFILYFLSSLLKPKKVLNKKVIRFLILPFLFSILYYFIFAIINNEYGKKVFNYALVYSTFPLLSCYLPLTFSLDKKRAKKIRSVFFGGLIFAAVIIIFESIFRNIFGIDIVSFVPQLKENLRCGEYACRARGFSSEPIVAGLGMSIGLNYSIISLKGKYAKIKEISSVDLLKNIFLIIIFSWALICTGSSASFVAVLGPLLIFSLISISNWILRICLGKVDIKGLRRFFIVVILLTSTISIIQFFTPNGIVLFEDLLGKIALNESYTSVRSRLDSFLQFRDAFLNSPLGISGFVGSLSGGISSGMPEGTAINWYMTILGDSGIIGFVFTLLPLFLACKISYSSQGISDLKKIDKLIMLLTPAIGLMFHGTFYTSLIWPLIIVIYYL